MSSKIITPRVNVAKDHLRVPNARERVNIYNKFIYEDLTAKEIAKYYNFKLSRVEVVLFTTKPANIDKKVIPVIGLLQRTAYNAPVRQKDHTYLSVEDQLLSSPFYNPRSLKGDELNIYKGNI